MISRRTFLVGLGGLATASAARAQAHALGEGTPLLLDPGRTDKTLHLFARPDFFEGEPINKWQVSLGPWQQDPPPAPHGASICVSWATASAPRTRSPAPGASGA